MAADRSFLLNTSPSGGFPWRSEGVNSIDCYSILDERARVVAMAMDPVDADLIVAEHNEFSNMEDELSGTNEQLDEVRGSYDGFISLLKEIQQAWKQSSNADELADAIKDLMPKIKEAIREAEA